MDILSYAGLRRSANLASTLESSMAALKVSKPLLCNLTCSGLCNNISTNTVAGNYNEDPQYSIICAMECLDSQSLVRRKPAGLVNGFKIWDTSYGRCGCCCAWTVPAGTSCIQFQIWGAGGGTSGQCCCGGSPFGPSGAYATVTIPAVVGCVYTLCAGCAYCCYASQTTAGYSGISYVTGYGLTNFCALNGSSAQCAWGSNYQWSSNWPSVSAGGPNSCSGWNFCWDASQDLSCREYEYAKCAPFYGTATGSTVYGFRGINPRLYVSGSDMGASWTQAAPIMGYISQSMCRVDWSCWTYNGQCGGCYASVPTGGYGGFMLVPGQGGWPSMVCGGGNGVTYVGDTGRGGMVCVSYY